MCIRDRTHPLSTAVGAASRVLFAAAVAATMGLTALSYRTGAMSIGTVFLLVFYVGLLESPLDAVRRHLAYIQRALASVNRTREFFVLRPEVTDSAAGSAVLLAGGPPAVRFAGVTFAYKDRRVTSDESDDPSPVTTLTDVSFDLAPGRVLGVLGRTGSGKTTLTRLLFRLYDVDAGAITLDGTDLRAVGLGELRRRVGLVTQDEQLLAATARDNLTLFGNSDPARPDIRADQNVAALDHPRLRHAPRRSGLAQPPTEDVPPPPATAGRAAELGGTVLVGPHSAGEMGRFIVVRDPQGAVFPAMQFYGPMEPPPGAGD